MQVMILAAGRSTRLGNLGALRPKPLVPICGYPAITFNLVLCAAAGLRDVVINLHHHGEQIRAALGDGTRFGLRLVYSEEAELLGTGGGLQRARGLFRPGPVLSINGKVVAALDLPGLIAAHQGAAKDNLATLLLRENPNPAQFPPITTTTTGRIVGLRGERFDAGAGQSVVVHDRMFTGVQIIAPALLDRLPVGESDVLSAAHAPALRAGAHLSSALLTGHFEEHSTPQRYLAGNVALLRQPELLTTIPGPLTGVDPAARVASTATLHPPFRLAAGAIVEAGAVVGPDVVVGPGGVVAQGARIARAVVWEGGVARGDLRDVIVTVDGDVAA